MGLSIKRRRARTVGANDRHREMAASNPRRSDTSPTPRLSKAQRRRQLLDHAKQLFVTLGYPQTTPEIIAATAGVRETVLQRHFESKQAIFAAVLQEIRVAAAAQSGAGK